MERFNKSFMVQKQIHKYNFNLTGNNVQKIRYKKLFLKGAEIFKCSQFITHIVLDYVSEFLFQEQCYCSNEAHYQ